MMVIYTSQKANNDLLNIWFYSAEEWGDTQADQYLNDLETGINALKQNPRVGTLFPYRQGYRKLQIKSHVVFYREKGKVIEIIRVLHKHMDVDTKSYSQIWCMSLKLSGDLIRMFNLLDLNSIFKLDARNDLGKGVKTTKPAPSFLCTLAEFKHHVQHAVSRQASF